MTIDWDKPIETVEGQPAWVIAMNYRWCGDKLRVVQIEYSEFDATGYYHQDGKPAMGSPQIRNRKTRREGWINIYPFGGTSVIYPTEKEAKSTARPDVITTIKIEWEE